MKKIGAFIVHSLSFNLANLNWPTEQSTSIRYLCVVPPVKKSYVVPPELANKMKVAFRPVLLAFEARAQEFGLRRSNSKVESGDFVPENVYFLIQWGI